jgi:hypothetical protein
MVNECPSVETFWHVGRIRGALDGVSAAVQPSVDPGLTIQPIKYSVPAVHMSKDTESPCVVNIGDDVGKPAFGESRGTIAVKTAV